MASVLVLSGGGSRGAYEVGVLKALVEKGHRWNAIYGVSVGALNGAFLAQYPIEKQDQGIKDLEAMWRGLKGNGSIYKPWLFGKLAGLWRGGAYNTKPLRQLIAKHLDVSKLASSRVYIGVGATCLEDGQFMLFNNPGPFEVLSSASFPIAFPPARQFRMHWIDGGVRNITPLRQAIEMHATAGNVGDVVVASPISQLMAPFPAKQANNVVYVALRTAEIMANEIGWDDLRIRIRNTPGWSVYSPATNPIEDPLNFDPKAIAAAIDRGYLDSRY